MNHIYKSGQYLCKNKLLLAYLRIRSFIVNALFSKRDKKFSKSNIKTILISNLAHIGDALFMTSMIQSLKREFPNSTIDIILGEWSNVIYKKNKNISKIYTLNHWMTNRDNQNILIKYISYLKQYVCLLYNLRKKSYDLTINPFPYYPNTLLLYGLIHSKYILSYNATGMDNLCDKKIEWNFKEQHIIEYDASLLEAIGIKCNKELLKTHINYNFTRVQTSKKKILIQPCSGNNIKEWNTSSWVTLCNMLSNDDFRIILLGHGARERSVCDKIISKCSNKKNIQNLCSKLNWDEYLSLIKSVGVLVGVDSLSAHLAASLNVKTLTLRSGITHDSHYRPYSPNSAIMRKSTDCYPCKLSKGCSHMSCIRKIDPKSVYASIMAMVNVR